MESSENQYDPDELLSERLDRVEDGRIKCPVNRVDMTGDDVISVVLDTPSSVVSCDYIVPEIPTTDTDIVQVCRYYGVDPATPSQLEDKMLEWDGDEIYFERVYSPVEKIKNIFSFEDTFAHGSMMWNIFFFVFFPITGLAERGYTSPKHRPMIREDITDYLILVLVWFVFLLLGIFVTLTSIGVLMEV